MQQPIPIWVGGNSRASRRRVTEHAQGWIPTTGGTELSTTAGTWCDSHRSVAVFSHRWVPLMPIVVSRTWTWRQP
nr:hypothetical protein [Nocardia asiatica]